MTKYPDKRVVITGGTSGIGLVTAKLLLEQGARVLVTGRNPATVDAARQELGDRAIALTSDATSVADIDQLADRARSEWGGLDVLFVNAGQTAFVPFEAVTEAVYDQLFAINAKGAYFTVQKLAPLIPRGGAIVLTTSVANVLGLSMAGVYSATKAALRSMTRSFARELLPREIRVNAVSPGPIETSILDRAIGPEAAAQVKSQLRADSPMKRFGRPEEVAKAVMFLAFEATYMTGAELAVDGGGTQL